MHLPLFLTLQLCHLYKAWQFFFSYTSIISEHEFSFNYRFWISLSCKTVSRSFRKRIQVFFLSHANSTVINADILFPCLKQDFIFLYILKLTENIFPVIIHGFLAKCWWQLIARRMNFPVLVLLNYSIQMYLIWFTERVGEGSLMNDVSK